MENPTIKEGKTSPDRIWRTCRHCSHKWLGRKTGYTCPKCKKWVGLVKEESIIDAPPETSMGGIKVEATAEGALPPLPEYKEEQPKKDGDKKKEGDDVKADVPADTYTEIVGYPFALIADRTKHKHWELTAREKQTLAPLLKKVGDKWIGKFFEKYPDEAALGIGFAMIVLAKVLREGEERKKAKVASGQMSAPVRNQENEKEREAMLNEQR